MGRIRAAQIQAALRFTPVTMGTNLLNAIIIAWVVWSVANPAVVAVWAFLTVLMSLAGLRGWQMSRRGTAPNKASVRAIRRVTRRSALLALMWALVPALWFDQVDHAGQLVIATLVTGMICAGGFALATIPSAAVAYIAILTVGAFFGAAKTGDATLTALGILMFVYALIVVRSAIGTAMLFVDRFAAEAALIERGLVIDLLLYDFEENGSDWLFQIDTGHAILSATSRFAAVAGKPPQDIVGTSLLDFVAASHRDALRDTLERGAAFRGLEIPVGIGGAQRWWSLSASPMIDDNKQFAGYRGVGSDITQRRRAEEERQHALADVTRHRRQEEIAEAQNKAKSAVLAVMSHEIRTPMNAVLGLTSALIDTSLDSEQRHLVDTIHESGNSLLRLLNDILDFSKLDAGNIEFESRPFSPAALIDQVADIMEAGALEKGLSIRAVSDPNIPTVVGDHMRIRQVMLNLVANAIKFTESGGIDIAAQRLDRIDGEPLIVFSVRDTGIGIEPDRIDRLFHEFAQADASINRRFGGTGLGLAICKRIVEQMGGDIRIKSLLGGGSTFTVALSLPISDAAALRDLDPAADAVDQADAPLSILLAEDNATNQLVFSKLTQGLNARITIAANGREALDHAARTTFDVVFMDMRMPEMDGLAATRAIRALGGPWSSIPIIALTANAFAEDVKACRDAGMDEFLAKPLRKGILLRTLSELSAKRHRGDSEGKPAAVAYAPSSPQAPAAAAVFDQSAFDILIEEIDCDGVAMAFEVFFAETAARLGVLRDLSCAADRVRIKGEAHTLKGAAGTLGLAGLAALARTLELSAAAMTPIVYRDLVARIDACFDASRLEAERALAMAA